MSAADIILENGRVLTLDRESQIAEAVLIRRKRSRSWVAGKKSSERRDQTLDTSISKGEQLFRASLMGILTWIERGLRRSVVGRLKVDIRSLRLWMPLRMQ